MNDWYCDSKIISKSSTSWGKLYITTPYWVQLQAYGMEMARKTARGLYHLVFYVTVITGFLGRQRGFLVPFHPSYCHEDWVQFPTRGKEPWAKLGMYLNLWYECPCQTMGFPHGSAVKKLPAPKAGALGQP